MSHASANDDQTALVIDYLQQNPDFFLQHEDLLARLSIPHHSGQAVSLVERQVKVLREQLDACAHKLTELVAIARENELLGDRMHRFSISLAGADTFDELISLLQDELFDQFQADAVELKLFSSGELDAKNDSDSMVLGQIRAFLDAGKPACGHLEPEQMDFIFGPLASSVQSTAIIPLHNQDSSGILAIGSRSPDRFSANKGTLFLSRLGELLSQLLRRVSTPGL
ncbi:MAG: DUF484 family protein [Gammaproteobacteria bacterium]|nr:DUF484 family protein [Gammaproteobacteria bacterium]